MNSARPSVRRCLAPLDGCVGTARELLLDAGLAIRRLEDGDREDLWRHAAALHPGPLDPTIADPEAWEFAIDHRRHSESPGPRDDARANVAIRDVIRALRLHHPGLAGVRILWIGAGDRRTRGDRGTLVALDGIDAEPHRTGPACHLDPHSGADLRRLLAALRGSRGRHLARVLGRFDAGYAKESPEDRLIDLWIALEELVLPDGGDEPRHRAALRLACLLGERPEERAAIFELATRSHDRRRQIPRPAGDAAALDELVEATRDLARRALRARLLDPPAEGVLGLDRRLFEQPG
ncbi:MAG TPA: hypothetical protein VHE08_00890 [Solirubrobacterales bacterium]|nr:hypothetical protein [Solirubrobacterales bacterium]